MSAAKIVAIDCLAFERLLDEGAPQRLPEVALAHARECARCDRALSRARSLERALERHFAPGSTAAGGVPAGFTDRVMARVERGEARAIRWLALPDALPWWVRAAAEPAVLLAFALAALLLWRGDAMLAVARAWLPRATSASGWLAAAAHASGLDGFGRALAGALAPAGGAPWATSTVVFLGILPAIALLAIACWRTGERIAGVTDGLRTL